VISFLNVDAMKKNILGEYRLIKCVIAIFTILLLGVSLTSYTKTNKPTTNIIEEGKASYYGVKFIGKKTASGEIFTKYIYTCAHRTLPFGTLLKVTNVKNGEAVIVKVNDRGPFIKGRVLDLSIKAAKDLKITQMGVARVSVEMIDQKYSEVGNVQDMEKIAIEDRYAYIIKGNKILLDLLYQKIFENTSELNTFAPDNSTNTK
jgi:rare lipoprotein A